MREIVDVTKALADENRLRALYALRGGELCLCQIVELLELAPSTVCKHMAILWQARLIEKRKEGRWIYYRLMGPDAPTGVQKGIAWICGVLPKTKRIQEDVRRLKKILRIDREELCKKLHSSTRLNGKVRPQESNRASARGRMEEIRPGRIKIRQKRRRHLKWPMENRKNSRYWISS